MLGASAFFNGENCAKPLFTQQENIIYLSAKETAFIYRQNKHFTRTLTPNNPLLKRAGRTSHGAWCCCAKQNA